MKSRVIAPFAAFVLASSIAFSVSAATPAKVPAPKPVPIKPPTPSKPMFVTAPSTATASKGSAPVLKAQSTSGARPGVGVNAAPAKPQSMQSSKGLSRGEPSSSPTSVPPSGVPAYTGGK